MRSQSHCQSMSQLPYRLKSRYWHHERLEWHLAGPMLLPHGRMGVLFASGKTLAAAA